MNIAKFFTIAVLNVVLLLFGGTIHANDKACEILRLHFNSMGEFNKVDKKRVVLSKERIRFTNSDQIGMSYNISTFIMGEFHYRFESFNEEKTFQISGINGFKEWICVLDSLNVLNDKYNIELNRLRQKSTDYKYLCEKDTLFDVIYEGIESIDDIPCFKIKINSRNNLYESTVFIDTLNYYMKRNITAEPDFTFIQTVYEVAEYSGICYEAEYVISISELDEYCTVYLDTVLYDIEISPYLFLPSCDLILDSIYEANVGSDSE